MNSKCCVAALPMLMEYLTLLYIGGNDPLLCCRGGNILPDTVFLFLLRKQHNSCFLTMQMKTISIMTVLLMFEELHMFDF